MRRVGEDNPENSRIMLGLLDAVEQNRAQSQRLLASELGIALGLVNVRTAPARRYAYYLTPQGFAEKSRLTVDYLSYSFGFFRQAKTDCSDLFKAAAARGVTRILLIGQTDLAEIASLCAIEHGVKIVGVVQKGAAKAEFIGLPVFADLDGVSAVFDAVMVTDMAKPRDVCEAAIDRFGVDRVLVPDLLRVRMRQKDGGAK